VYVVGFLRKLAVIYQVPVDDVVAQYHRERVSLAATEKTTWLEVLKRWWSALVFTPRVLSVLVLLLVVCGSVGYIVIQVILINRMPNLVIVTPAPDTVVSQSSVTVIGNTEPGVSLSISGQNVLVDNQGHFETVIGLTPGQQQLLVTATNKFGKMTTRDIVLRFAPDAGSVAGAQTTSVVLEISVSSEVTLQLTQDGQVLPEEVVPAGAKKRLQATRDVVVATSNAGATSVTINGREYGVLGRLGEKIAIPFTADSVSTIKNVNNK
jgi:hypothetical protein